MYVRPACFPPCTGRMSYFFRNFASVARHPDERNHLVRRSTWRHATVGLPSSFAPRGLDLTQHGLYLSAKLIRELRSLPTGQPTNTVFTGTTPTLGLSTVMVCAARYTSDPTKRSSTTVLSKSSLSPCSRTPAVAKDQMWILKSKP